MAAEPKISGSTIRLMMAQRMPMLKYNAVLLFCGIEYNCGFAGGCDDSVTELRLDMHVFSNLYLTPLPLISFPWKNEGF